MRSGWKNAVLEHYKTTREVAAALGCSVEAVKKHANRLRLGWRPSPRVWLLGPRDVERLRGSIRLKGER